MLLLQEEFDFQYGYVKSSSNLGKLIKKKVDDYTQYNFIDRIKQAFPILFWLPNVTKSDLVNDIIAGITVGTFCVPQGYSFFFSAFVS